MAHLIVVDPTNLRVRLAPDDLELASKWPRNRDESEKNHRVRTRAARAAERAVAHYYSRLSPPSKVIEVALGQIRPVPSSRWSWQVCDLDRDGVPVDVKNVRKLQRPEAAGHSPRYAEWFVNDKSYGRDSPDVVIAAATTEPSGPDHAAPTRFVSSVIGEWTPAGQSAIKDWTSPFPDLPLTWTARPTRSRYLPGWLLDFPPEHYRPLTAPLISACVGAWDAAGKSEPPFWFAALVVARGADDPHGFTDRSDALERYLLQALARLCRRVPPTRPQIVLFSVAWLLDAIVRQQYDEARERLCDALWGPMGEERYPLGLDDPQKYVAAWIRTISDIADDVPDLLRDVSAVRLVGSGILRARLHGQRGECTLVAYCHCCGTRPLLLGRDAECGCPKRRLRCECGACERGCADDLGRLNYWANRW